MPRCACHRVVAVKSSRRYPNGISRNTLVALSRGSMFFSRDEKEKKQALPLLPLRDIVLFPHMVVPLFVGREKSIAALNAARAKKGSTPDDKPPIAPSAQKRAKTNDPAPDKGCHVPTL